MLVLSTGNGMLMKTWVSKRICYTLTTGLYCVFVLYAVHYASTWAWQTKLNELSRQGLNKQTFYTTYLRGLLEKSENLPQLLARNERIFSALKYPKKTSQLNEINKLLESITSISDTSDIYLMDRKGDTIAASNWQTDHSFVGKNFSFRPYFKKAMQGGHGRYYAMGTTSSRRGYYFSYPIKDDSRISGVVVVKIDIELVETNWDHLRDNVLVTDPQGVVFLTANSRWRFKPITPLEKETQKKIVESRRYPNISFKPLSPGIIEVSSHQFVEIKDNALIPVKFLKQTVSMPEANWDVHILSSTENAQKFLRFTQIATCSSLIFIYILICMLMQRSHRMSQLDKIKEDARKNLEHLNEELELRVKNRTEQLEKSNECLRGEVQERKQVESVLKETQNELTHAAKMAVLGQMSAQINHELNQPLAAIRSYTDNGIQFLNKERLEETMWNLEQIGELTERMAEIGKQLKLFSRKSSGQISVVPLHGVIDGALDILKPALNKSGVEISIKLLPEYINVHANSVLLQQVLVNLLSNALHAMENTPCKQVTIEATKTNDRVNISVCDTGIGIDKEDAKYIFDPFFTTKKSGQGLGLGLTISDRIIQEFDSRLALSNNELDTGTCFNFSLTTEQPD